MTPLSRGKHFYTALLGCTISLSCVIAAPAQSPGQILRQRLGIIPPDATQPAPDNPNGWNSLPINTTSGCHFVYIGHSDRKQFMVVDGQPGPEFDQIQPNDRWYSPDGTRVTYTARSGDKWFVMMDGQPGPPCLALGIWPVNFTPDGKHYCYPAQAGTGKWIVIVDGKQAAESLFPIEQAFISPNARRLAYITSKRGSDGAYHPLFIVDGQEGIEPAGMHGGNALYDKHFVFSSNGSNFAYPATINNDDVLVINGGIHDLAEPGSTCFSPDGNRYAFVGWDPVNGRRGEQTFVNLDGRPQPTYGNTEEIFFSPDSARLAYSVRKGGKSIIVMDGRPGTEFDWVGPVYFSPDSKRFAYEAESGKNQCPVIDNQVGRKYDEVNCFVFSPDSRRVAYLAKEDGSWMVVTDHQAGPRFDDIKAGPTFTSDSRHILYAGRKFDKWHMVFDDQVGPEFDDIWFSSLNCSPLSPDGKHWAYGARTGRKWVIMVDGRQAAECNELVSGPIFRSDGMMEYLAELKDSDQSILYRVTESFR